MNRSSAAAVGCLAVVALALPGATASSSETFAIEFHGGTVAQYVDLVRDHAPHANIVIDGGVDEMVIGKITLPAIELNLAMEALARTMPDGIQLEVDVSRGEHSSLFTVSSWQPQATQPPRSARSRSTATSSTLLVEAISVALLAERDELASLLQSLQQAHVMMENASNCELELDADAGLLLVKGTGAQRSLVREIIDHWTNVVWSEDHALEQE